MTTLVVVAKSCLPGQVKTRLCPPLTLREAAEVAQASLDDTLMTVRSLPVARKILFFDGEEPPPSAAGLMVMRQPRTGGLDQRLAAILDVSVGPTVVIAMDTPQMSEAMLAPVLGQWPHDLGAWLGFAADGGFWALALAEPDGRLVRGVAMSRSDTGARQYQRLVTAGLHVGLLGELADIDTFEEADQVAGLIPGSRTAAVVNRLRNQGRPSAAGRDR